MDVEAPLAGSYGPTRKDCGTDMPVHSRISGTWVKVARVAHSPANTFYIRPLSPQELESGYVKSRLCRKSLHSALIPAIRKKDKQRYMKELCVKQRSERQLLDSSSGSRAGRRSCLLGGAAHVSHRSLLQPSPPSKSHIHRLGQTNQPARSLSTVLRDNLLLQEKGNQRLESYRRKRRSEAGSKHSGSAVEIRFRG